LWASSSRQGAKPAKLAGSPAQVVSSSEPPAPWWDPHRRCCWPPPARRSRSSIRH
jgi:hypothetical protein